MGTVIDEFRIGQYRVLKLDEIPKEVYHKYRIERDEFEAVPIYDLPQCIAVISEKKFYGKNGRVYLIPPVSNGRWYFYIKIATSQERNMTDEEREEYIREFKKKKHEQN